MFRKYSENRSPDTGTTSNNGTVSSSGTTSNDFNLSELVNDILNGNANNPDIVDDMYKITRDEGNDVRRDYILRFVDGDGSYVLTPVDGYGEIRSDDPNCNPLDFIVCMNDNGTYYSREDSFRDPFPSLDADGYEKAREIGKGAHDDKGETDDYMWHSHRTHPNVVYDERQYNGTREEFLADVIGNGQLSIDDAKQYYSDLDNDNIRDIIAKIYNLSLPMDDYFTGTVFGKYYGLLHNLDGGVALVDKLKSDCNDLKNAFNDVFPQMAEWHGKSEGTAKNALDCILGHFQVTMENISNSLEPAVAAIDTLSGILDYMYQENINLRDYLRGYHTNMGYPLENRQDNWDEINDAYQYHIEREQGLLDGKVGEAGTEIIKIDNYQKAMGQFGSFVLGGGDNSSIVADIIHNGGNAALKHHDDIIYEFENFVKLPVITNLTDYEVGQVVMFDDAYGTKYVVYATHFDGDPPYYIEIIACDENGDPIQDAVPIKIYDQREIVPVGEGNEPDRQITSDPDEPTPPGQDEEDPDEPTPPGQDEKDPDEPTPPDPDEPDPDEPTPPGPDEPDPDEPRPDRPFIPDTGIDGLNRKNGSNGNVSLGALAGLAFGGAGMGLSSMMKDKDKDEEESKEENKQDK